jgi:mannose-6-phosphate isomerase-like protein (cupin superfamily)
MRLLYGAAIVCALAGAGAAQANKHDMAPIKPAWGPVGPNLPAGAEIAALQGDAAKAELFTVRLKMPKGYVVAPHYHGTDLHVTVISGEFSAGMGDTVDLANAPVLRAGDFITVAANQHHFDAARSAAVVQIYGMGPFSLTYLNPDDDPQRKRSAR